MEPPKELNKYIEHGYATGYSFEEMKEAVNKGKADKWFPKGPPVCGYDPNHNAHHEERIKVIPIWVQPVTRITYDEE